MASPYFEQLYDCSFNGAPFFSRAARANFGRKVAIHNYPYRDTVWPEDTGRKARQFRVEGFIVGDDVVSQRDWMKTVCETPGPGILIHPSHGILSVSLLDLEVSENWQHGREIRLNFSFIESGQQVFPSLVVSTLNAITGAIGNLNTASANDFVSQVATPISFGASVVQKGVQTVTTFTSVGSALVKGATNLFHLSSAIPGAFGRFAGGRTGSGTGSIIGGIASIGGIATQLSGLINLGATSRANVDNAAKSANTTAGAI